MPRFSVIMAAYNRGAHIVPSVISVLNQSFQDFELLVVGDCCTDDTESAIAPFLSGRVRWMNLAQRGMSQSTPNNAGIAASEGSWIAYLGHDDIWAPDHLSRLADLFEAGCDFAVSGAIFHLPPGAGGDFVTGIFNSRRAPFTHFFPPSSFAHTRAALKRIGTWMPPFDIRAPVDADFLLRAAKAGCRFASTREITVHKFAAGHRYLSYLQQESFEQQDLLQRMTQPDYPDYVRSKLAEAKARRKFMRMRYPDFQKFENGEIARRNSAQKASTRPAHQPLNGSAVIPQDNGPRAEDWLPLKDKDKGFRWSGRNPNPKVLIPYTGEGPVEIGMRLRHAEVSVLSEIRWQTPAGSIAPEIEIKQAGKLWEAVARAVLRLLPERPTAITLQLPAGAYDRRAKRGIAMAETTLKQL